MFPPEIPACEPRITLPDERTSQADAPLIPEASVADRVLALLAQSRAAHDRKKKAAGLTDKHGMVTRRPNYPEAEAEMALALTLRLDAHALDPNHESPAWGIDQAANKGLSHQQMCEFMAAYALIP